MHQRLNELWEELKLAPPGERFQRLYITYAQHDSELLRGVLLMAALGCFTIGVVFTLGLGSGPAFLFFALSVALVATQSSWLARHADEIELTYRDLSERMRTRNADDGFATQRPRMGDVEPVRVSRLPRY